MDPEIKNARDATNQAVTVRHTRWNRRSKTFCLICPWCKQPINGRPHYHEWLVKRNTTPLKRQHLIFHEYNIVPLHPVCHETHGQTRPMARSMLFTTAALYGAHTIAIWYQQLRDKHLHYLPGGQLGEYPVEHQEIKRLAELGMRLDNTRYDNWQTVDGDFRVMAGLAHQARRTKMNGVSLEQMSKYIDTGRYLDYLLGIIG